MEGGYDIFWVKDLTSFLEWTSWTEVWANIFKHKHLAPFLERTTWTYCKPFFRNKIVPSSISRMDLMDGSRSEYFLETRPSWILCMNLNNAKRNQYLWQQDRFPLQKRTSWTGGEAFFKNNQLQKKEFMHSVETNLKNLRPLFGTNLKNLESLNTLILF